MYTCLSRFPEALPYLREVLTECALIDFHEEDGVELPGVNPLAILPAEVGTCDFWDPLPLLVTYNLSAPFVVQILPGAVFSSAFWIVSYFLTLDLVEVSFPFFFR